MSILQTIDLKKDYGSGPNIVRALDGVNFSVEQGEFVAVVGTSGSGKSTLLHMMGGLDIPTSGSVIVRGNELAKKSDEEVTIFRRRNIGFIFQNYNLIESYTVLQNVVSAMLIMGVDPHEANERAKSYLDRVGIGELANRRASKLSAGQKQRLTIARALAKETDIIIADEPTGNLDPKNRDIIMDLLRHEHEKGRGVILITHDMEVARESEKVYLLRDGGLHLQTEA